MSVEENIELVRNFFNDTNSSIGNLSNIEVQRALNEKYMSNGFINHTPVGDLSSEQDLQMHNMLFKAFPDLHVEVKDIFGVEDKVFARIRTIGTHKGEFRGYPATGKKIDVMGGWVFRISKSKFVETWNFFDRLSIPEQIGINPQT